MKKFTKLTSKVIPLPHSNIDTDQIIPARYLKAIDKAGMADGLFANWRYHPDGSAKTDFVLNLPHYQTAQILFAGDNFGCGSSREHAPWALTGWGIQVVISTSFADIFYQNALKNGLLPIMVDNVTYQYLLDITTETPHAEITIDLENQTVFLPGDVSFQFPVDCFAKKCLLAGVDQLGYILSSEDKILEYERRVEA